MPNLGKIKQESSKEASTHPDFTPNYGPITNKPQPEGPEGETKPKAKQNTVGDADNEDQENNIEESTGQSVGDVDEEYEEGDEETELLTTGQSSDMARNAIINAYNNAANTASDARKKSAHLHEKTKYTIGDLICVILAIVKDLIEIIGTVALGLGILVGPLVSFFVTVLLFIIRTFKGGAITQNMVRSTFLWVSDIIVPVFPVYTIGMILILRKYRKEAMVEYEENQKIIQQAEQTMKSLEKLV